MEMVLDINNMAPHEIVGAIAQLILALAVMGNMLLSWRNGRRIESKVEQVHVATNGLKDELVVATKLVGEAKGREDERRETRERNGNHNV